MSNQTIAVESSRSDPPTERPPQRGEIGFEESMRNLGLGAGGEGATDADAAGESLYPQRPGEPDCIYYVRTGFCRYGAKCRFNHPHDRAAAYEVARASEGDYPERPGHHICQYYMRTGSCKFGSSCKYHHPRHEAGTAAAVTLNFHGYPLRPGEKECSYYVRTGHCKFSMTCKFHHPQPDNVHALETIPRSTVYPTIPHAPPQQQFMVPNSYVQGPYAPMILPPGVVPYAGWTPYMSSVGAGQIYGVPSAFPAAPVYGGSYPPIASFSGPSNSTEKGLHPERPRQPECQHYLRTGECKYGSLCRYHHPAERNSQKSSYALTPVALPLRPGVPTCAYFLQHGDCKYGLTCKFNHPMDSRSYTPSTSSPDSQTGISTPPLLSNHEPSHSSATGK